MSEGKVYILSDEQVDLLIDEAHCFVFETAQAFMLGNMGLAVDDNEVAEQFFTRLNNLLAIMGYEERVNVAPSEQHGDDYNEDEINPSDAGSGEPDKRPESRDIRASSRKLH